MKTKWGSSCHWPWDIHEHWEDVLRHDGRIACRMREVHIAREGVNVLWFTEKQFLRFADKVAEAARELREESKND